MEQVVNIIAIQENCLLVTKIREGDFWTLPGGRVEKGESNEATVRRETKEELPNLIIIKLSPYKEFLGITPHSKNKITVNTFFTDVKGSIEPGAELTGTKWADALLLEKLNMTDISKNIIKSLKNDGYLTEK